MPWLPPVLLAGFGLHKKIVHESSVFAGSGVAGHELKRTSNKIKDQILKINIG